MTVPLTCNLHSNTYRSLPGNQNVFPHRRITHFATIAIFEASVMIKTSKHLLE